MADLDVQRKGPSIWPWVVGLIVLALLIWALVELFEDDATAVTDPALERSGSVENRPEIGPPATDAGAAADTGSEPLPPDGSDAATGEAEPDAEPGREPEAPAI